MQGSTDVERLKPKRIEASTFWWNRREPKWLYKDQKISGTALILLVRDPLTVLFSDARLIDDRVS